MGSSCRPLAGFLASVLFVLYAVQNYVFPSGVGIFNRDFRLPTCSKLGCGNVPTSNRFVCTKGLLVSRGTSSLPKYLPPGSDGGWHGVKRRRWHVGLMQLQHAFLSRVASVFLERKNHHCQPRCQDERKRARCGPLSVCDIAETTASGRRVRGTARWTGRGGACKGGRERKTTGQE